MKTKQQKEYDEFMNEQFRILKGHMDRFFLRCYNKYMELKDAKSVPKQNEGGKKQGE